MANKWLKWNLTFFFIDTFFLFLFLFLVFLIHWKAYLKCVSCCSSWNPSSRNLKMRLRFSFHWTQSKILWMPLLLHPTSPSTLVYISYNRRKISHLKINTSIFYMFSLWLLLWQSFSFPKDFLIYSSFFFLWSSLVSIFAIQLSISLKAFVN